MIKGMFKLILLILFFGFISISPKTRYLVGITLKKFLHFFYGLLNMKIEKNGLKINQVGYLTKNLSHRIK